LTNRVAVIRGDGIGPEITDATIEILTAAGARIDWESVPVGASADALCGEPLPWSSLERLLDTGVVLKAPLLAGRRTGGVAVRQNGIIRQHPSINNALRRELGSFVNVRPVRGWRGVSGEYAAMDLVIMREVTEDIYSGIERQVDDDCAEATKRITGTASRRIAKFSCEYAERFGRRKVMAVHKANVLHLTDGLFLESVRSVVAAHPGLQFEEQAIDAACFLAVRKPHVFDVVVLPNQYGDIFSDLAAALAGSLGLAPGVNIGERTAMFEAAHGAAPDIAGQGIANPIGLVLSGALLLDHIGQTEAAERVRSGIARLLESGTSLTPDLGGTSTTREFTQAACTAAQCL
jgi:isocitrate dehydrogenase (NAD+)